MDRRTFVAGVFAAAATGRLHGGAREPTPTPPGSADLVLRGGLVYDGSGAAPFEADVAVSGQRISAVAPGLPPASGEDLDVRGLVVAPGFIDIHSHSDLELLIDPRAESKVRQGVTTEVAGQDGASMGPWSTQYAEQLAQEYRSRHGVSLRFRDLAGFFQHLDDHPSAVNVASMIGHGTVRTYVMGSRDADPSPDELARMTTLVTEALQAGACGLSTGLEYIPGTFATLDELARVATPLRRTGLPYATHVRNEDDRLLAAVEEALAVAQRAGVSVHLSHLKAQGARNWWKAGVVLQMLDAARGEGIDVTYDRYPYVAYSTGLGSLFPVWARADGTDAFLARLADPTAQLAIETAVRDKIAQLGSWDAVQVTNTASGTLEWSHGRRLGQLAHQRGEDPYALLVQITVDDRNRAGMVGFGMSEDNTSAFLAHPLGMICSDGTALATSGPLSGGAPHPRSFGTFPRVLGHYCRDRRVMPLETAIHKMTGQPSARLRLANRGHLTVGAFADLVVFDPNRVADRATFAEPHRYPAGIPHVLVNGTPVIWQGEHTGARPGQVLRSGRGGRR